ncbi:Cysteine desulfurase [Streptococcus sp. DD10]|uniref:cysteine desulfurase family protein n=1 Tax=Streptococcus sp. DD10 TaxID=1777878 RepID=UPI000792D13F|nr:cysteine desulfurase family protein [Streptococcus sp. DD10]KXT77204.1 Cysteine desulfurase [Streptococcus sp. DD10]
MIYFDNAATTALSKSALTAMTDILSTIHGNPSSTHGDGRKAARILRESRSQIAHSLNVESGSIIFTSGGSESNNLAIKGYALAHRNQGKHIISTTIEHHAVLETLDYLKNEWEFDITLIKPKNNVITSQQIKDALRPDTILVSTMFANNETGYLLPIKEIGEVLSDHPAIFHVDAVQAIGKMPIYPKELGIDLLSASAHKFHGPKGVGFLYANHVKLSKLLHGGSQENKRRAGTENLPGIVGMATALTESLEHWKENYEKVEQLAKIIVDNLSTNSFYLNQQTPHLPHVLNIGFPNLANDLLLLRLDLENIAVSTGSACTAGAIEPSHVLASFYGGNSPKLTESIRISISELNTEEEALYLTQKINDITGG